jgi:hypothetical protein
VKLGEAHQLKVYILAVDGFFWRSEGGIHNMYTYSFVNITTLSSLVSSHILLMSKLAELPR